MSWPQYQKIDATKTNQDRLPNDAQPCKKLLTVDKMMKVAASGRG